LARLFEVGAENRRMADRLEDERLEAEKVHQEELERVA